MRKNLLIYILLAILFVWTGALSFKETPVSSNKVIEEVTVQGFSTDLSKAVLEHKNEVVTIVAEDNLQSGFVYRQNENKVYVLTCYHGISNSSMIEVLFGETYKETAAVVGYDIYTDLAVLMVESPYEINAVTKGDASLLKPGEFVLSIGTPGNLNYIGSCELGIVSLKRMVLDNTVTYENNLYNYYLDLISFTSNLRSGYSGSPLFNMNGQIIGVSTMSSGNTRFAITINEAQRVADQIMESGKANRNNFGIDGVFVGELMNYEKSNLGINIDSINGIYVREIKDSSPLIQAGVNKGDIILKINDIEINDLDSYLNAIYMNASEFNVTYQKNDEILTVSAGANQ